MAANNQNFDYGLSEDIVLLISLTDAQPVSGWQVQFQAGKRFGWSSGLVTKSIALASGIGSGASGIAVLDSGQGQFLVRLSPADVSGLDPINLAYQFSRLCSGHETTLSNGFVVLRY